MQHVDRRKLVLDSPERPDVPLDQPNTRKVLPVEVARAGVELVRPQLLEAGYGEALAKAADTTKK